MLGLAATLLLLPVGCASSYDDDYYRRQTPRYEPYPSTHDTD